MTNRLVRAAALIVLPAATLILATVSCGGGGAAGNNLSGHWAGAVTLSIAGGGTAGGDLDLQLSPGEDFASGVATWVAAGQPDPLPIGGSVRGASFSFLIDFPCASGRGGVVIEGTVAGDTMTVSGGSGIGCSGTGPDYMVSGATGALTRSRTGLP